MFVRHSQRWLSEALKRYKLINGHVELDNTRAKRWLRWLGAKIDEPLGGRQAFEIRAA